MEPFWGWWNHSEERSVQVGDEGNPTTLARPAGAGRVRLSQRIGVHQPAHPADRASRWINGDRWRRCPPISRRIPDKPSEGRPILVTGTTAGGRHIQRGPTTNQDGRFTVQLPAGTYKVYNGIYMNVTRSAIVVAGKTSHVRLVVHVF